MILAGGLARGAAVAVVVLALVLSLGEAATRLAEAHPALPSPAERAFPFGMFRADPDAGVALAKHAWIPSERFATNTFGHRDRPREAGEPAPWMTRVAVIGGTTGAGRGVADAHTFARLLEDAFPAAAAPPDDGSTPRGVEVWNLAVPGYGAEQALLRLEADWETVQPDVVVWAFDLADTPMRTLLGPGARRVVDGELVSGPWTPFASAPYEDERATFLRAGLEIGPLRIDSALQRTLARDLAGSLLQVPPGMDPFDAAVVGGWAWLWMEPPPDPVELAWELVGDVLERLARACADRGARLVILGVPGRIDVDPQAFAAARDGGVTPLDDGSPARPLVPGLPATRLRALAKARDVPWIDPLDALRGAGEPVHHLDFPAWNAAGHRVGAEVLAAGLATLGELPPHDPARLRDALLEAVPRGDAETRFDGGFRAARGARTTTVRWERATSWAW